MRKFQLFILVLALLVFTFPAKSEAVINEVDTNFDGKIGRAHV